MIYEVTMTRDEYIEKSKAVIELIGTNILTKECDNTYQHLMFWKSHGIPKAWARFLELRFPKEWKQIFKDIQVYPPRNNQIIPTAKRS
jgi:hypothetical protein